MAKTDMKAIKEELEELSKHNCATCKQNRTCVTKILISSLNDKSNDVLDSVISLVAIKRKYNISAEIQTIAADAVDAKQFLIGINKLIASYYTVGYVNAKTSDKYVAEEVMEIRSNME
jgi:hypothetical protein